MVKPVVRATKNAGRAAVSATKWVNKTAKSAVASAGRVVKATGTRIARTLESGATALVKTGMYLKEKGSRALADIGEGLGKLGEKIADGAQWVKDKAAQGAKWAWENRAEILKYGAIAAAGAAVLASGGTLGVAMSAANILTKVSVMNTLITAGYSYASGSISRGELLGQIGVAGLDALPVGASKIIEKMGALQQCSRELIDTAKNWAGFQLSAFGFGLTTSS